MPNTTLFVTFGILFQCRWLFTCTEQKDKVESRITCPQTSKLCPGYSITCALCGMFLPGTCSVVCPVIGIYCGTSGYACNGNEEEDTEMTTIGPNPREINAREMEMIEVCSSLKSLNFKA